MGDLIRFRARPEGKVAAHNRHVLSYKGDWEKNPHWLTDCLGMSDHGIARNLPMVSDTDGCEPTQLPLQFAGTEDVPMIKPPLPNEGPSPIDSLVATITLMAANRKFIKKAVCTVSDYQVMLEDLTMLVDENVVVGLRTVWARRVAVPVLKAHRALQGNLGSEQERARSAIEILKQCNDEDVKSSCIKWLQGKYHV